MKGIFIVLEGIDGCGKSTQIQHLSKWLPQSGLIPKGSKLITTREPGGTKLGNSIRELLLRNYNDNSPEPLTELLLYAADRAQHVSQVILPAINNGHWVISDRFSSSTMAYQGFGRDLNKRMIEKLEDIATKGITPNLTLLLDISVTESIKRRRNNSKDRMESEGEIFLERVSDGFKSLAKDKKWITVSSHEKEELVSKAIEKEIIKLLNKNNL
tara:strand:+ start:105 stop:746 length:642 start_codon:yes stop_codon:yes gene_type:complete